MTINLGSLIACVVVCSLLGYAVKMFVNQQPFRNAAWFAVVVLFVFWFLAALGVWNVFGGHGVHVQ